MSKYSSKNAAFQFGLLLFMVAGLSMGIILTTGNAPLNFFSFAQQVQTNYSTKPEVPLGDITLPPKKLIVPGEVIRIPGCRQDGKKCSTSQVCCGFCNNGRCESLPTGCIPRGDMCNIYTTKCCPGSRCSLFTAVCR